MIKGLAKSRTARAMALKPSMLTRASGNSLSGYSPMMSELYHTPSERFFCSETFADREQCAHTACWMALRA